jgi:uracil-DNA glycosylase
MGLFAESEKLGRAEAVLPRCGSCKLRRGCESPRMPASGKGRRRILVVAEAPGAEEDRRGEQLIGRAGQLLRKYLRRLGVDLDRDCWKTNAVCCRPPDNRTPTDTEIEACRPMVMEDVRNLQPLVILLLGGSAVKSVVGSVWHSVGPIGRWVGWRIPWRGSWLCPTWHPSYLLRDEKNEALSLLFDRHLEAVLAVEKPAPPPPECKPDLIYEPDKAAAAVRTFIDNDAPAAFDFETDRLKPDHPDARIVTCAISDRSRTVAYPMVGEAEKATGEFLHSTTPKVGWNIKFEERWTRRAFGRGVRNWIHDGMQAAHVLDNRPEITSLKFQAFVRLGFPPYADAVDKYLKAPSSNKANRIRHADLGDLLLYNALDAFLTLRIGVDQMEELKG